MGLSWKPVPRIAVVLKRMLLSSLTVGPAVGHVHVGAQGVPLLVVVVVVPLLVAGAVLVIVLRSVKTLRAKVVQRVTMFALKIHKNTDC